MHIDKRLLKIIFATSLTLLLLLSVMAYDRLSSFKKHANTIDNSNKVLLAISNLRSGFNTTIADQRSYLLTKNQTYFNQFQAEKDSLRHTLQLYKKLTRGNKEHAAYAKKLQEVADKRIQSLLVEVINDTSTARYKYVQNELIEKNENVNSNFFELLNTIDAHEKQLLSKRLAIKEFEEQFAPFLLFVLALTALAIITYSFLLLNQELDDRETTTFLLQENVENLNRSNKELEAYAYVASHDLQEPLRKIRMFSDMLLKNKSSSLDEQALGLLERMNTSSERMTNLIKDLLSLSRLNAEGIEFETVDLNKVVEETAREFEDQLSEIEFDVGQLPTILAHKGQMYQLFQNLIGNALKFRKKNKDAYIRIRAYEKTRYEEDTPIEYHLIVIKDNGQGFDNTYKDKMFSIFGRLEKTSQIEGTGIGLSICSRIMENHKGQIDAIGEPNVGAEFHLQFPKQTV
ncbi:CHASE3 domain-containing protein [Marinilongibacter aquaticus]|uniref:sensor histidine kinase n=1 Tax=Marinilongibacter aquaticus TaxID=2975157 RepID=UPI0021BDB3C2|nr:sensor histidine kinase [Marinilongibacter aquaticus]UBM60655.1 CHASE3 domain-containing protein [Marinilongibacter aquaticus]